MITKPNEDINVQRTSPCLTLFFGPCFSGQYCWHFCLPFSTTPVNIAITSTPCSQTMAQKSRTVPARGPCAAKYRHVSAFTVIYEHDSTEMKTVEEKIITKMLSH